MPRDVLAKRIKLSAGHFHILILGIVCLVTVIVVFTFQKTLIIRSVKMSSEVFQYNSAIVGVPKKKILMWHYITKTNTNFNYYSRILNQVCGDRCELINGRHRLGEADIVFMHNSANGTEPYPPHRTPHQIFLDFAREIPNRPQVIASLKEVPENYYNATMSFLTGADIYYPYGTFVRRKEKLTDNEWQKQMKRIVAKKRKGTFKVFSNCRTPSKREKLIKELSKYVDLDLYGKCGGRSCDAECYKNLKREYRFYLAFENSVCDEYITEKFYKMVGQVVPIVLKEDLYKNRFPANSYIAVDSFNSLKALVEHLSFLTVNDTAYMNYFKHTQHYEVKIPTPGEVMCMVCDYGHIHPPTKSYHNISGWYDSRTHCDNDLVTRILGTRNVNGQ